MLAVSENHKLLHDLSPLSLAKMSSCLAKGAGRGGGGGNFQTKSVEVHVD